ncbi:MAG: hypothetical protein R3A13_08085 [Bdellovibrionota bacterium]
MGKPSSPRIDFRDLEVRVLENSLSPLNQAVSLFNENYINAELEPLLKAGRLYVNSTDFIALLGYLEPNALSEFELKKLKQSAIDALNQLLLKSLDLDRQSHYRWCLTALKSFEIGRFL